MLGGDESSAVVGNGGICFISRKVICVCVCVCFFFVNMARMYRCVFAFQAIYDQKTCFAIQISFRCFVAWTNKCGSYKTVF